VGGGPARGHTEEGGWQWVCPGSTRSSSTVGGGSACSRRRRAGEQGRAVGRARRRATGRGRLTCGLERGGPGGQWLGCRREGDDTARGC
jgi:hypothetical protein